MVNFPRCMGMIFPLAVMALGADSATGRWVLEPADRQTGTSRSDIKPDVLDLKADGAKLTGTLTHQQGFVGYPGKTPPPSMVSSPISRGKVDGNHLYFEVTRDLGGGRLIMMKYEGTISGDKLDLNETVRVEIAHQESAPTVTHLVGKKL